MSQAASKSLKNPLFILDWSNETTQLKWITKNSPVFDCYQFKLVERSRIDRVCGRVKEGNIDDDKATIDRQVKFGNAAFFSSLHNHMIEAKTPSRAQQQITKLIQTRNIFAVIFFFFLLRFIFLFFLIC